MIKIFLPYAIGTLAGTCITLVAIKLITPGDQPRSSNSEQRSLTRNFSNKKTTRVNPRSMSNSAAWLDDKFQKLSSKDHGDIATQINDMSDNESKALIRYIFRNANAITGISYHDRKIVGALFSALAESDLETTCQWIDGEFDETTRQMIYKRLLSTVSKNSTYYEVIAFAKKNLDEKGLSEAAGRLLLGQLNVDKNWPNPQIRFKTKHKQGMDNASALFLLKNIKPGPGRSGEIKYAKDFDFEQFISKALELKKDANNKPFSFFPSNLLQVWAKRDRDAAIAFYNDNLMGEEGLQNNSFSDLVRGYAQSVSESEAQSWLQKLLKPGNLPDAERSNLINTILPDHYGKFPDSLLQNAVKSMNLNGQEILTLYNYFPPHHTDSNRLKALQLFPNNAIRQQAFEEYLATGQKIDKEYANDLSKFYSLLKTLGHDESQINRIRKLAEDGR